jgi:glutathione peroxidase
MASIYDFSVRTLDGANVTLDAYRGKALLVVNVASKCGLTPQYEGLEALYRKLGPKGLMVLGFPCNQFGHQEPGNAAEIRDFCSVNYGVSFPLFEKIDVNGEGTHPLYRYLKSQARGILGTEGIKWNFTKFLIRPDGEVAARYAPTVKPQKLEDDVAALL